jgi:predicted ABC-type ATPase
VISKPSVIIIAGPNGAGKTSFARKLLPLLARPYVFLNFDEWSRNLSVGPSPVRSEFDAGKLMLARMTALIGEREDLIIETTLSSRHYAQRILEWRDKGYVVGLVYLRLPSVDVSFERVKRRVAAGGHGIPEDLVRRRFEKSLRNLETLYKPIVDEWYVWDSLEGDFSPVNSWTSK